MEIEQDFDGEIFELEVEMEDKENLRHVAHYPIKSGPRTFKSVNIFEIIGSTSGKKVVTFWKSRLTEDQLRVEEETQFKCDSEEVDRLVAIIDNLEEVVDLDRGDYIFLKKDSPPAEAAGAAINSIKTADTDGVEKLAAQLIESVGEMESSVKDLSEFESHVSEEIFNVENLVGYARTKKVVTEFETLVDANKKEHKYQSFLEEYPWLFGNRYVGDTGKRELTRDEEVDFCLETVDGYFDVFEIKRPGHDVVNHDSSHDTYYPSHELSKAMAQTQNYLKEIESNHGDILARDGLDMLKPRGTIIIGSELNDKEKEGLRILNSYFSQIRVRTYSELISMGKRLTEMYESNATLSEYSPE